MWRCTFDPAHGRFTATPRFVEFNRDMKTWEMQEWKQVFCAECGEEAEYDDTVPGDLTGEQKLEVRTALNTAFETMFSKFGDTPKLRLMMANYTMGYMGVSYGLHVVE